MRTFGVEEELLLVDAVTLSPLPSGHRAVALSKQDSREGHCLTTEFQQEQLEVAGPPQLTLADQLDAIRIGRALAETAAERVGGRVVALPTAPGPVTPHLVPDPRYLKISKQFGFTVKEQLTCGYHVHVRVNSREEAVAVLDRIRVWLPVVMALSANSPFWQGIDTEFASYRYQAWNRWPTAGPTDVFGSAAAYDHYQTTLLETGVPLDTGMLYFDARVCEHHPTVEVRVADVCLEAEHAAVIAALVRALVETAARDWVAGKPPPSVPTPVLRIWSWHASRYGMEADLIDPTTGTPSPAENVITRFLSNTGRKPRWRRWWQRCCARGPGPAASAGPTRCARSLSTSPPPPWRSPTEAKWQPPRERYFRRQHRYRERSGATRPIGESLES